MYLKIKVKFLIDTERNNEGFGEIICIIIKHNER